jgi:hypothetical protein
MAETRALEAHTGKLPTCIFRHWHVVNETRSETRGNPQPKASRWPGPATWPSRQAKTLPPTDPAVRPQSRSSMHRLSVRLQVGVRRGEKASEGRRWSRTRTSHHPSGQGQETISVARRLEDSPITLPYRAAHRRRHPCHSKPCSAQSLPKPEASSHSPQHQTQPQQAVENHWLILG